jgi:hypothetical protein
MTLQRSYQSLRHYASYQRLSQEDKVSISIDGTDPAQLADHAWALMRAGAAASLVGPKKVAEAANEVTSAAVKARERASQGDWPDEADDPNHLLRPVLLAEQDFVTAARAALKVGFN